MRLLIVCCSMAITQAAPGQTETHVALVIGNSAYQHTRALLNPRNDAEAVAKLLGEKGFAVTFNTDLDYRAMRNAVRAFGQVAREADVALVYFAGHGLEVGGQNYIVPIDARLERESDLEYEVVTLASMLNAVSNARRLRLVILDACRNNPLSDKMQVAGSTRSVTRGLARVEPSRGVLVAYAAKEGTVAQDGATRHSPYAEALLRHLPTPGLDVRLMFGKVRDDVLAATRNEQEPFTYGSLSGDVVPLVPGAPLTMEQDVELAFWASVKDSKTPAVLRTYLKRYPDGEFATIARALIEHYERQLKAEVAEREEAKKRQEEGLVAAAVKRIEEERRAREAALAEERKRAEEAKNASEAMAVEEKQRAEWAAQTEKLSELTEQMRATSAALAAAEKERLQAVKEAEDARQAAEAALAAKREAEKAGSAAKLAALPKIEGPGGFDGTWQVHRVGPTCRRGPDVRFAIHVGGGVVSGRWGGGPIKGRVSPSGQLTFKHRTAAPRGGDLLYSVTLQGNSGTGTFHYPGTRCQGTLALRRN
jgi:uncharacterized caspase-like protein